MFRTFYFLISIIIVVVYQGCSPFDSFKNESNDLSSLSSLKCSDDDPRLPVQRKLKRLNKIEIHNTLIDIFSSYFNNSQIDEFETLIAEPIESLPDDSAEPGEMEIADSGVSLDHLEKLYQLSNTIVQFIESRNLYDEIAGSCITEQSITQVCKSNFISSFGEKILRRSLSESDVNFYIDTFDGHSDGIKNLISVFLNSPLFFYHVEMGEKVVAFNADETETIELSSFERANRLSYLFLQSLPDSELFEAARNGTLNNPAGVREQVNRLLKSTKVRRRLTTHFASQWLELERELEIREDIDAVRSEIREMSIRETSENRIKNIKKEVYDYFDYLIWEQNASYKDLMTSDLVFPRTNDLAEVYGTSTWSGEYDLGSLVRAPAQERSGLLTRAHFLFTGGASTRPIMRGVGVYRNFLCGVLNLPPDNSNPEGVVIEDDMSEIEYVKAITEVEGTACVGCHQKTINPLGFKFENFDAFGRHRVQEKIYFPESSNQSGQVLTTVQPQIGYEINIEGVFAGYSENAIVLSQQLAESSHSQACFVSKIWNFASKENLEFGENPCAIKSLHDNMTKESGSIIEVFRNLANQPEFFKRTSQ